MSTRAYSLPVIICCLVILACGGARKNVELSDDSGAQRPVALIFDEEIAGDVLGKRLNRPVGMAVDPAGRIFLSDAGNNRIVLFDITFKPTRDMGGYGSSPGLFDQPGYIVLDNSLNLWIADEANDRLVRCDNRLNFVDEIKLIDEEDALKYGAPSGLAVTDYGEVWMADRENNRLATFDNTGRFDRFIGDYGYTGGQLSAPEKVLAVEGRRFVVCDAGNERLAVYDDFGNYHHEITDPTLEDPLSVAIAPDGLIWILEGRTGRLCCFSSAGEMVFSTGPQIVGSDRPLKSPSDIAFLRDGRMLISDSGNDRVLVCSIVVPEE